MKDFPITVSYKWAQESQRRSRRCMELDFLIRDMLRDMPEPFRSMYELRWRGVDMAVRGLYDGPKVNKPDNVTTSSQIPQEPVSTLAEGA